MAKVENLKRLCWIAGFFDGEGSVQIALINQKGKASSYHNLRATACNTDPTPLWLFKEDFGGSVFIQNRRPNEKPVWIWRVTTHKAKDFLRILMPHLVVKKKHAEIGMALQETFSNSNSHKKGVQGFVTLTPQLWNYREQLRQELRELNKKGVKING